MFNRMKRLWAAGALIAGLSLLVAGCGGGYDLVLEGHPSISVVPRPVPYVSLIRVEVKAKVLHTPKAFHLDLEVYRWEYIAHKKRSEWIVVADRRWGYPDLPQAGKTKTFQKEFECEEGHYYTKWHVWGAAHDGTPTDLVQYWPYAPGSNASKRPSLKEARHITSCSKGPNARPRLTL